MQHTKDENPLERLMEGNLRYTQDKLKHPDRNVVRRLAVTACQSPFAVILGCADLRVSPEIIFDQGIGDLFVVRVAGHVLSPVVLDSIEYAVIYLKSKLIMVLGHESCGAVTSVVQNQTQDIENVANLIKPAMRPKQSLSEAIKANVALVVSQIVMSPTIKKVMDKKELQVVGGYYNLNSGKVDILA